MSKLKLGEGAFLIDWPHYCLVAGDVGLYCFRAKGHTGRHAHIGLAGGVKFVWGEDVHAEKRAKGRCHVDS